MTAKKPLKRKRLYGAILETNIEQFLITKDAENLMFKIGMDEEYSRARSFAQIEADAFDPGSYSTDVARKALGMWLDKSLKIEGMTVLIPLLAGFRKWAAKPSVIDYECSTDFSEIAEILKEFGLNDETVAPLLDGSIKKSPKVSIRTKPAVFIGSSSEGLKVARQLEKQLRHDNQVTLWSNGVYGLGGGTLETICQKVNDFDFAVLVLSPDDMELSRDKIQPSARDNVIFELGLFMGKLGRLRTFIVFDTHLGVKIPSDLAGVTAAVFSTDRDDGNLASAVSPAVTDILDAIEKVGML